MNFIFALSGFLNFIASVFFASLVYSKGREKKENIYFTLFSLSVAFWSFGYYFWQVSETAEEALLWCRILMVGAIFIPVFYFQFIANFLGLEKKFAALIKTGYLFSFIFILSNFTSFFVKDVRPRIQFEFWPTAGIMYGFFLAMFFGFICLSWFLMLRHLGKNANAEYDRQIKYLLFGTFIGFVGGATNFFLWYGIPIPPYGNFLVLFYVVFTAVAVLKYRLFDLRVILTEILVGIMGVILVILPFLMPTFELKILTILIFILFSVFGYYLIKFTNNEGRRREHAEQVAKRERELRREAEELAANLKHLNEAKNQFLLSTQHHLRSPLSVVQGYLSMIGEGSYGRLPARVKEKVDVSLDATKKLIQLVNELLDVAHFQMNKGIVAKQPTDAVKLVASVVSELAKSADSKNILLRFDKPVLQIAPISIDPNGFREAVYNIIDNAIKYTGEGEVTVSILIINDRFRLIVADTGMGMDNSDKLNLFSRTFERGDKAKEANATGKGIGLYLAAQMVIGNGGTICAESEGRGKGSKFIIELPIKGDNNSVKSAVKMEDKAMKISEQ